MALAKPAEESGRFYIMKRLHVYISGLVQGVSFRAATKKTATGFNITGWVRNMEDGRVEAVLEGADEDVEKMIAWCKVGPRSAQVTNIVITREHYTGSFNDFAIKFDFF
ncbi:MAG: acylphosphatase [Smithella sp.]